MLKQGKLFGIGFLILFFLIFYLHLNAVRDTDGPADKPEVIFDISTIEKIIHNPDSVLKNVKKFWESEPVYIAAKQWEPPGYPIHYGEFEKQVKELSTQDQNKRIQNINYKFAKEILQSVPLFKKQGMGHLLSYLPKDISLNASVLLGSYIYLGDPDPKFSPTAFVVKDTIVFNVSHKSWRYQTSEILHTLTHELVHVAHHKYHKRSPTQKLVQSKI